MERKKLFNHRLIVTSGLLIAGLVIASAAEAGDRHRNHRRDDARLAEAREAVRDARDYDRRLDRRGRRIDAHLDVFALFAAATGNYDLAYELDRKGDRIERRLDRRGDRILRDARHDRRHTRRHSRTDNHNARDRRDHDWNRRDRSHRKGVGTIGRSMIASTPTSDLKSATSRIGSGIRSAVTTSIAITIPRTGSQIPRIRACDFIGT